ncbi:hypothetical protein TCAL_11954 [Tigriopus californicus]|uniref:Abasic site processing protein HMCES n=1 Tax=Tigriopus californicus TaxID=6832 RepID=A0A553PPM4_TIGCA|nr:abasic site processing protein HMCES-like [Tigriopus californicus]TRY79637.1 hypothetical protein TCAL_11954 [Tigriopus californicus]|eukprot:TCALIF_11954-PA protein Name:"Similar to Hmces Embryonic stem cell-specific 5-hydroxymethylcytosine-binding protein (Rattus norvegicus)" AED:0.02 eAED:0.02 QI:0/1/0.75/1/0.66/0.5/4/364/307
MCGRTCCTLSPEVMPFACTTLTGSKTPIWREAPDGGKYFPANNIPPSRYTPVLWRTGSNPRDLTLQPMLWGFIPPWHRGEVPTKHGLTTNNARLEGLGESKLYKAALSQNRRCVVVADGFYEWKKLDGSGSKQPYLVYAPQENGPIESCPDIQLVDGWSAATGWTGPRPLFMAGIYSIWENAVGQEVFSYSIITRESNEVFNWLHHRVPAILSNPKEVDQWLDPELKGDEALKVLIPLIKTQLTWHPVSPDVGNVRNQSPGLQKPVPLDVKGKAKDTKSGSASLMSNWLKKAAKPNKDEPDTKKSKP